MKHWIDFYKQHRKILDSDIIHLRRPDGKDWDGILHVNPTIEEKGLLMLYNPLEEEITRELRIPVYFTGLGTKAVVSGMDGKSKTYKIDRDYYITLNVKLPAKGTVSYVLK